MGPKPPSSFKITGKYPQGWELISDEQGQWGKIE
ncbi:hypothetical protein CRD_00109 [Raphidiopsis brookii D9]|nr:hypothetical protein CRD_00109 [Raphidiopsis brookii D9]